MKRRAGDRRFIHLSVMFMVLLALPAAARSYRLVIGFPGLEIEMKVAPGQAASGSVMPAPSDPALAALQPPALPVPDPLPPPGGAPATAAGEVLDPPPAANHFNGFEASGTILAVPLRDQFDPANRLPGSFGGPTALAMVLDFYGRNLSTNEVADQIGVADWGCNGDQIAAGARALGFDARYDTSPVTLDQLRSEIEAGHPVIVNHTTARFPGGHYAVVVGFTEDGKIVLHDPAGAQRVEQDVDDFARDWHSPVGNKLAVFVAPRP